jgi:hypothetical protein
VKLPRGSCPVCHADVALRKGGVVREHKDQRHELYATGQSELVPVCEGSGQEAATADVVEGLCRVCGCTDHRACYREAGLIEDPDLVLDDGSRLIVCSWEEPDLCTACVDGAGDDWRHPAEVAA